MKFLKCFILILAVHGMTMAYAGRGRCNVEENSKAQIINGGMLASKVAIQIKKLEELYELQGKELKVLIIARRGTDPGASKVLVDTYEGKKLSIHDYPALVDYQKGQIRSKFRDYTRNIKYSHLGLAFKNAPKGEWGFYHELNPCQTRTSNIYKEDMWTFFLDDPYKYGAMIMVPDFELQDKIEDLIINENAAYDFHGSVYNALALPFSTAEQNSNQWALEVMAAAMAPKGHIRNRSEAQQALYHTGYRPTRLSLGFKHSLGHLFAPDSINLKPHKYSSNYGLIEVVTVLSIKEWLIRTNQVMRIIETQLMDHELIIDDSKKVNQGPNNRNGR